MSKVLFADLFCGTGGFSKGFKNYSNDFELVFAIDILNIASKTTLVNHNKTFVINNDIRNVKPSEIEKQIWKNNYYLTMLNKKIDLIIGSPPCQGFSSIRPFRSRNDEDPRNSLFEEYVKYVNYFKPKIFVMENVIGITTHDNGNTLNSIQELFYSIGYETDWRILNTANFGIPQKRERFILIGIQKGGIIKFPTPTHCFDGRTIGSKYKDKVLSLRSDCVSKALTVSEAIDDLPMLESGCSANYYLKSNSVYQAERRGSENLLTLHKSTKHSDKMLEIIRCSGDNINSIPEHLISSGFSSCYSRLNANEPANTITVNFVHPASSKCIHPIQDRALTPREGARLQGFDDSFIFCGNRTQIVKQIGNAVPPLLGYAIASALYPDIC